MLSIRKLHSYSYGTCDWDKVYRHMVKKGFSSLKQIVFFGLFLLIGTVQVEGSDGVIRQQDQIIGHESQRQRGILDRFRKQVPPKKRELKEGEVEKKKDLGKVTVFFKEIRLEGASILSKHQIQSLLKPYLNKHIFIEEINNLLRDITNAYVALGYITTRAYLKGQNIKNGVLVITVLEGKLGDLRVYENGKSRIYFPGSFILHRDDFLNIRDLEQTVDQINRLPSLDAHMKLEPGEESGESNVKIETETKFPLRCSLGMDNYGSEQTGQHVVEASIGYDDLIGLYDLWYLSIRSTKTFDDRWKRSRSLSFLQSLPFGYWTVRFSINLFDYISKVEGVLQAFRFSGIGQTYRGEVERIIHRDGSGKTGISVGLTYKDTRSFVEGNLLETSTYRLVIADLRAFHVRRFAGGVLNSSLTYFQGTRFMGATKDESSGGRRLKAQFSKIAADLGFYKPFSLLTQNFAYNFQAHGQLSPHDLYSTERASLGGQNTVRGFKESKLGGDTGGYIQNELICPLNQSKSGVLKDIFGTIQVFVGYDLGWIHQDKSDPFERGNLKGGCLGIRATGGRIFGEAVVSRAFAMPQFVTHEGTLFFFKFGTNF